MGNVFEDGIAEAIELSDDGKHKQALTKLNALIKAFPDKAQAYFERAMTLLNLDRDAKAAADLEKRLRSILLIRARAIGWPASRPVRESHF